MFFGCLAHERRRVGGIYHGSPTVLGSRGSARILVIRMIGPSTLGELRVSVGRLSATRTLSLSFLFVLFSDPRQDKTTAKVRIQPQRELAALEAFWPHHLRVDMRTSRPFIMSQGEEHTEPELSCGRARSA